MASIEPTETRAHMPELDGLRAVAILLVIAFHSWFFLQYSLGTPEVFLEFSESLPWVFGFVRRGDLGVDIFFVLSGFLLSWQLFVERSSTGQTLISRFYMRRIFRIFPLYIVALALAMTGSGLSFQVVGNLLAYNIWFNPADILIPWSWSLSVELEFYAVVPFLILLFRGKMGALLTTVGFVLATVGWCIAALVQNPQLGQHSLIELLIADRNEDLMLYFRNYYVAMPVRISQFIFGTLVAWTLVYRREMLTSIPQKLVVFLVTIALVGAIAPLFYNPYGQLNQFHQTALMFDLIFGRVVFGISIAVLILLLQLGQLPNLKRVLSAKPLVPIARFSFSMYLFHPLFVYLGMYLLIGDKGVTSVSAIQYVGVFLLTVCGAMALGFVTWRFLERPAIRYGHRWFG